jgi:hypothetical protein
MKIKIVAVGWALVFVSVVSGDTFRHKETGETFNGFRTQKRTADKVLVYHSEQKKLITIEENRYEITFDGKGRRDSVVRVQIRQPEVLISQAVAERVAESIAEASNSGPQFIVVEIDSPGGRGDYMKLVASAIEQTTNCPVVAFISGGDFSGAYSAAAVVALACDELYMAPSATIGAAGPMTGSFSGEQYAAFLSLYSPDILISYSSYVESLVRNKPALRLIARALVDKTLSVVEVVDTDGKTHFVERDNRLPTQTIVRTLSEGASRSSAADGQAAPASQGPQASEFLSRALTLSAPDAVRIGLADKQAASIAEIMTLRGVQNAQVVNAPDINATIRRFAAGRRSIGQSLATIDRLETYASTLEEQIARVEDQLRTGTVTRESSRSTLPVSTQRRGQVILPNTYDYYGTGVGGTTSTRSRTDRSDQTGRSRRSSATTERVITDQPLVSLETLRNEQSIVLRDLVAEYRKAINLARRWPGGLPPELPIGTLESNMNSAAALLDNIARYPVQTYQLQQQQPQQRRPVQTPRRGY